MHTCSPRAKKLTMTYDLPSAGQRDRAAGAKVPTDPAKAKRMPLDTTTGAKGTGTVIGRRSKPMQTMLPNGTEGAAAGREQGPKICVTSPSPSEPSRFASIYGHAEPACSVRNPSFRSFLFKSAVRGPQHGLGTVKQGLGFERSVEASVNDRTDSRRRHDSKERARFSDAPGSRLLMFQIVGGLSAKFSACPFRSNFPLGARERPGVGWIKIFGIPSRRCVGRRRSGWPDRPGGRLVKCFGIGRKF